MGQGCFVAEGVSAAVIVSVAEVIAGYGYPDCNVASL